MEAAFLQREMIYLLRGMLYLLRNGLRPKEEDRSRVLAVRRLRETMLGATAENALADALASHRTDRLRGLARQLREVAGTLERAGRPARRR